MRRMCTCDRPKRRILQVIRADFGPLRKTCTCTPDFPPADRYPHRLEEDQDCAAWFMSCAGRFEERHSGCSMMRRMSLLWWCGTLVVSEFSCRIKRRTLSRRGRRVARNRRRTSR